MTESNPDDRAVPPWIRRAMLWFFAGVIVWHYSTGIISSLRSFFIVITVSVFLSFAIEPTVNRLEKRGIRRGVGTWIVFAAIMVFTGLFIVAMATVLADQITDFANDAPAYIEDIETWINETFDAQIDTDEIQQDFVDDGGLQDFATNFADDLLNWGTTIIGFLFQIFTIALFTFYLVAEGPQLRRLICSYLNPERQREVLDFWDLAIEKTGGYIASRGILALLSAGFHWPAFVAIGVPFPLPMALWMGAMSQFIPVIGTYIAGALPVMIATLHDPITGLWTLGFVVVYQQIENYLFAPRITAQTMEIHVAVAFGAVIVGAAILGPVGALLALPMAATLQAFVSTYLKRHEVSEEVLAESRLRRKRD
ncbi:MAG: AI-2E family transporter [Acidobacteria bacterium]|nr:AI-2E family transporter [Acidobacteriota bacterium]